MKRLRVTVPCARAATAPTDDGHGNMLGETRAAVTFDAAFVPPTTMAASQIIDGAQRETTVTKPTLLVEPTAANAAARAPGALRSGDAVTVNGETGWQIDGDPALWVNLQSGRQHPMVVELRRSSENRG